MGTRGPSGPARPVLVRGRGRRASRTTTEGLWRPAGGPRMGASGRNYYQTRGYLRSFYRVGQLLKRKDECTDEEYQAFSLRLPGRDVLVLLFLSCRASVGESNWAFSRRRSGIGKRNRHQPCHRDTELREGDHKLEFV